MAVSISGGWNRSTRRKWLTCRKSLTNFITECCIEYTSPWNGFKLTTLVVIFTDCTDNCKSNYHTITTTSILLVEETGVPWENHQPVTRYWQNLSHNVVSSTHRFKLTTLVVIGTDWTDNCKSNYYTITTTTDPLFLRSQFKTRVVNFTSSYSWHFYNLILLLIIMNKWNNL